MNITLKTHTHVLKVHTPQEWTDHVEGLEEHLRVNRYMVF